ncbi:MULTISPECIES: hypothetical protein [Haloferax]|jgi:lipopolysaccharide export LptBFGC system permease protein LptF|uniref:Uncharacterized protein n=6 Tax=Haloferax TaxID=2251 RepID=D4GP90_HALVD|nr:MULTISPECIES: hypothetical protein [Haloferax]ADE01448.1 uncharacterized protein HVO_B0088 [Haloferax volcanii DS2]ELY36744.1 hypothetical protein C498_01320 [Haloferax volcanii DS2]ELZ79001.1 hypothetical protein C456_01737 [Haloferax lucentense DSM 14919]ELZ95574.1 hypothetical protein C452_00410 [Haloferax alexandrinus JCM 10717]MBC9988318.1 hypothetical protein [Haloferax sp. AS1]
MSVNASRVPSLRKAAASNRNFIMTALAGVCMILLARFVLDGTIAGMFGVWGISLVGVAVGGYLLLRLWGAYN